MNQVAQLASVSPTSGKSFIDHTRTLSNPISSLIGEMCPELDENLQVTSGQMPPNGRPACAVPLLQKSILANEDAEFKQLTEGSANESDDGDDLASEPPNGSACGWSSPDHRQLADGGKQTVAYEESSRRLSSVSSSDSSATKEAAIGPVSGLDAADNCHSRDANNPIDQHQRVELRFLVRRREAGALIGKRGSNIKRLRETFKHSSFTIPDTGNGPERIVCLSTNWQSLDSILNDFAHLLLEKSPENDDQIELKLLIHSSQAGTLIGVAGQSIKKLRNDSKAAIKIYELCCPSSSERVCAIKAKPSIVVQAIKLIRAILAETPPKGIHKPYDALNFDLDSTDKYGGYLPEEHLMKAFELVPYFPTPEHYGCPVLPQSLPFQANHMILHQPFASPPTEALHFVDGGYGGSFGVPPRTANPFNQSVGRQKTKYNATIWCAPGAHNHLRAPTGNNPARVQPARPDSIKSPQVYRNNFVHRNQLQLQQQQQQPPRKHPSMLMGNSSNSRLQRFHPYQLSPSCVAVSAANNLNGSLNLIDQAVHQLERTQQPMQAPRSHLGTSFANNNCFLVSRPTNQQQQSFLGQSFPSNANQLLELQARGAQTEQQNNPRRFNHLQAGARVQHLQHLNQTQQSLGGPMDCYCTIAPSATTRGGAALTAANQMNPMSQAGPLIPPGYLAPMIGAVQQHHQVIGLANSTTNQPTKQ